MALAVAALAVVVLKNGIGVFPSWPFLLNFAEYWSDPSTASLLVPPADYLKANFVAAWISGALGFTTPTAYFFFNLVLTGIALTLPFLMTVVRQRSRTSLLMFITIVGGPIAVVLLTWVGGYDAVSVIGITVAALARHSIVGAIGWLLVGMNHPSLAVLGFLVWLPIVMVTSVRSDVLRRSSLGFLGLVLGAGISTALVNAWGGATNRWEWFIANDQALTLHDFLGVVWPALFGTVGVLWFVLLRPKFLRTWVVRVLVGEIVILTIALPFFVLDVTRVIALVMFAPVLVWIANAESIHGSGTIGAVNRQLVLPAIIVPIPLVWEGNIIFGDPSTTFSFMDRLELPEWYPLRP